MGKIPAFFALFLLTFGHSAVADATSPGEIAEGKRLSLNLCGACHMVAADQQDLPVLKSSPPFFFEIANDPKTSATSIRNFLETTHWDYKSRPVTMPSPDLDEQQKNAIIAYILSLKR